MRAVRTVITTVLNHAHAYAEVAGKLISHIGFVDILPRF